MDCFIKKIFDGKADNDPQVHIQFQKFSKGDFKDKALIIARNSKGKYSISTTYEYSNEFARIFAEKLGKSTAKVSGPIVSTRHLKEVPEFAKILADANIKQFAGVKQFQLNKEISGEDIIKMLDASPSSFFGLSFSLGDTELKVKPKAPKSGKPSTKDADAPIKADFCKLITTDKNLVRSLLFDLNLETFKKAEIRHNFIITDIILPKGETDPAKIREKAVRKGKVIRKILVDEKTQVSEANFLA